MMIKRFFLFCFLVIFLFCFIKIGHFQSGVNYVAELFSGVFQEKVTPEDLLKKYEGGAVRVLIVPGHDNISVGAVYKGIRETDLNIELAHHLLDFFNQDEKFQAFITREKNGDYADWFKKYLTEERPAIVVFRDYFKKVMSFVVGSGSVTKEVNIQHNPAADNASLNLYAVNKLANDHNIDIVLHVHFNDYPTRPAGYPGKYSGFAIYVPERQLPNYRVSAGVAEAVEKKMAGYFPKSDFPKEAGVIVEDQQLIAVGSNASREGVSLLIEYGYIYEPQFVNSGPRFVIMKELAGQTYWGIKNYFVGDSISNKTTLLPYKWELPLRKGMKGFKDIVHLQVAFLKEGLYPPEGKNLSDCPMSGVYGNCTAEAVCAFQEKYGLGCVGNVGPETIEKLNELYSI